MYIRTCKSPKTSQRPQKPRRGDQLSVHKIHVGKTSLSPALYQIMPAIAKLLISFQCQVKPRRQRGATVAIGDDSVVEQERNRDRIA